MRESNTGKKAMDGITAVAQRNASKVGAGAFSCCPPAWVVWVWDAVCDWQMKPIATAMQTHSMAMILDVLLRLPTSMDTSEEARRGPHPHPEKANTGRQYRVAGNPLSR